MVCRAIRIMASDTDQRRLASRFCGEMISKAIMMDKDMITPLSLPVYRLLRGLLLLEAQLVTEWSPDNPVKATAKAAVRTISTLSKASTIELASALTHYDGKPIKILIRAIGAK